MQEYTEDQLLDLGRKMLNTERVVVRPFFYLGAKDGNFGYHIPLNPSKFYYAKQVYLTICPPSGAPPYLGGTFIACFPNAGAYGIETIHEFWNSVGNEPPRTVSIQGVFFDQLYQTGVDLAENGTCAVIGYVIEKF